VVVPVRKILPVKVGEDGLCVQPTEVGPDREVVENHNRMRAAEHGHYADPWTGNTRTYDPKGNYVCGECNMDAAKICLLIKREKPIDEKAGSCEHWENTCAGDPEMSIRRINASYGVAVNGKGFGCHRCKLQEKAHEPDSRGRDLYCKFWDCRVLTTACCQYNNAPTTESDDGDNDDDDTDEYSEGDGKMADSAPMTQYGPAKGRPSVRKPSKKPPNASRNMSGRPASPLAGPKRKY